MLSVRLAYAFPGFALDVDFEAPPGLTALVGPSGAGKTSVLLAVAGLLKPDRGRIALGDEVLLDTETGVMVPPHRRRLACVFQDARLFPHLSVRANLLYGQRLAPPGATGPDLATIADLLGLAPHLARRPRHLSGGERARVALGRAILSRPRLLLMDEPLASLDEGLKAGILPFIESLRDEARLPILYVGHDPAEVTRLATSVVTMAAGRVVGP